MRHNRHTFPAFVHRSIPAHNSPLIRPTVAQFPRHLRVLEFRPLVKCGVDNHDKILGIDEDPLEVLGKGLMFINCNCRVAVIRPERMLCKPDHNLDKVSGLHPYVDMSVWAPALYLYLAIDDRLQISA
jgi:hypothetical protein